MSSMRKTCWTAISITFIAALSWMAPCEADTKTVAPVGAYAEIDIRLTTAAVQTFANGTSGEKAKVAASVQENAQDYAPPAFYALSKALFDDGHRDEGAFWFYAGQLRGRYDANRCADSTARQEVSALNQQYGTPINQYMIKDLPKWEAVINQVVEWDKKTPHHYDPRWINLHGMNAMLAGLAGKSSPTASSTMSVAASQWPQIEEQTRADYLSGFKAAMTQLKSRK